MIDQLKALKTEMLENMKTQKAALENSVQARIDNRYIEKKVDVAAKEKALDEALVKFKADELTKYNALIVAKAEAVNNKKLALDAAAKQQAEIEIKAEVAAQIAEYDKEILKLEKELG